MFQVLNEIEKLGIIPVIAIEDANDAESLAQALIDGGLPLAEVTFRTSAAKESLTKIAKKFPKMLLGAGTVLTVDQVKTAIDCGVTFIISPGLNPKVVNYCVANNIPVTPGVATPSDVEVAMDHGLEVVKFFPAEANGGLNYLKALSAPYGKMRFIPTGGIDEKNILDYLKFNKILACGGSWMVKSDMIAKKQFDEIKRLTTQAVQLMLGLSMKHVGMNCQSTEEAASVANALGKLMGTEVNDGNSSLFAGTQFELMKTPFLGKNGHIAIGTNFINRAIAYFERNGVAIDYSTSKERDGKLMAVYLKDEIGGFAFHLLQI